MAAKTKAVAVKTETKPVVAKPVPAPKPRVVTASFRRVHDTIMKLVGNKNAELSLRQLGVLTTIRIGTVTPGVRELATALDVNKPAITRAIDRLEELGLVKRQAHITDRRLVVAVLTPKGDALVESIEQVG